MLEQANSDLEIFNFYKSPIGGMSDNEAAAEVGEINPLSSIKAEISGGNLVMSGKRDKVSFSWNVPIK